MTNNERKKRYICSFVKRKGEELIPDVVVVAATNNVVARLILCEKYGVKNYDIPRGKRHDYSEEGINNIRLAETNTYEGGSINDNFDSDDS